MNTPVRTAAPILWIGVIPIFLAFGMTACGPAPSDGSDGTEPESAASSEAAPKAAPLSPAAEADRGYAELQRRLGTISDPSTKRIHLKNFLESLRESEAKAKTTFPVTFQVQGQIEALEKAIEAERSGKLAKIEEELRKVLEKVAKGELTDFEEAYAIIKKAEGSKDGALIAAGLEELKAKVRRWNDADLDFAVRTEALKRAEYRDDPVKAIALLAGFPPQYDDTPQAIEIRKLIDENYRKYAETRDERAKAKTEVAWQDLDIKNHRVLWPDNDVPVAVDDKENHLTVGPNKGDYEEKDTAGTCITFGEDTWIDVELHFEARLSETASIFFGARGHEDAQGRFGFQWAAIGDIPDTKDEWHSIVVKVAETSFSIVDTTAKKSVRKEIRVTTGPFGIRVVGDQATMSIRNMKVAVLKGEKPAAEAGEGDEGKKKKD